MAWEEHVARAFRLDAAGWARHANPWSGWTRMAVLPLLVLAGWSRAWIGWWAALPLALLLGFLWLNPRLFPPPRHLDAWISRGVLGEQRWLDRDRVPVPVHHRRLPHLLAAGTINAGETTVVVLTGTGLKSTQRVAELLGVAL